MMIRYVLLILGFADIVWQQHHAPIPAQIQAYAFFSGIVLLGIPHGAADLLVACKNAVEANKVFSKFKFLVVYIGMLTAFGAVLWFFPLAGSLLFILFAAYHFGETDLYPFRIESLTGKIVATSYGLVILSVILLNHFEAVRPFLLDFDPGMKNITLINRVAEHRFMIMALSGLVFFTSTVIYLVKSDTVDFMNKLAFIIRFACLLLILYKMPMLMGFTFYFVAWHSVLSLQNTVTYLRKNNQYAVLAITKQILLYSVLAMAGIAVFGFASFRFMNNEGAMSYLFPGLAVLTAPHMLVMHDMYCHLRINKITT